MLDINGINTNGILNQYVKQLQNSITNISTNTYQNYTLGNISSFSQILSKISGNLNSVNTMFQGAFPINNVEIDTRKTDKKLEKDEKEVEKSTTPSTKKKINGWNPYIAMGVDSIGQDKINPYVSIYYNKKK